LIKAECSEARLRLVGLDTDCGIANDGDDIDGLGFMVDPAEEIAGWSLSIVPVKVGGGTRIKIAEAFSRRCPVVTTSLGAYGYQIESGRECLVADSDEEMAEACLRLLGDSEYAEWMAEQARRRFISEWSWESISPRVVAAVEACMSYSYAP
jgi:glycosyltransferase involved in cell wall biosynthesis